MIEFIGGFILGAIFGVLMMAVMVAAGRKE